MYMLQAKVEGPHSKQGTENTTGNAQTNTNYTPITVQRTYTVTQFNDIIMIGQILTDHHICHS